MTYIFSSEFPFIIKQMHLYVDDHQSPHHEAVMVRELCIAIDENRFTDFFSAKEMCHLVEYGLSCALPMIIVRYMYTRSTTIFYSHFIY